VSPSLTPPLLSALPLVQLAPAELTKHRRTVARTCSNKEQTVHHLIVLDCRGVQSFQNLQLEHVETWNEGSDKELRILHEVCYMKDHERSKVCGVTHLQPFGQGFTKHHYVGFDTLPVPLVPALARTLPARVSTQSLPPTYKSKHRRFKGTLGLKSRSHNTCKDNRDNKHTEICRCTKCTSFALTPTKQLSTVS